MLLSFLCIELMSRMCLWAVGAGELPVYLTVVFTLVSGVLLVLNSLGCFFGHRWKKRRGQTGNHNNLAIFSRLFNFLILQQHCGAITLNRNATVSSVSHSLLISPCLSFHPFLLSPLLLLILWASTSCHIHPSKLSLLYFVPIFYLICSFYALILPLILSLPTCSLVQLLTSSSQSVISHSSPSFALWFLQRFFTTYLSFVHFALSIIFIALINFGAQETMLMILSSSSHFPTLSLFPPVSVPPAGAGGGSVSDGKKNEEEG